MISAMTDDRVSALRQDLRAVVGCRDRLALTSAISGPNKHMRALVDIAQRTVDSRRTDSDDLAVRAVLTNALRSIEGTPEHAACYELWGRTEVPSNLTTRMKLAAKELDVSYETFRAKREDLGRFNELLTYFAVVLLDRAESRDDQTEAIKRNSDRTLPHEGHSAGNPKPRPRRKSALVGIGVVVSVAVAATAFLGARSGRARQYSNESTTTNAVGTVKAAGPTGPASSPPLPTASPARSLCAFNPGDVSAQLSTGEVDFVKSGTTDVRSAISPTECAAGPVSRLAQELVQEVADADGRNVGAVMLSPDHPTIRLTATEWSSYRELGGLATPERSPQLGGFPLRTSTTTEGHIVQLSEGGLLIGPAEQGPLFWVSQFALEAWNSTGRTTGTLGYPVTNAYPNGLLGFRQDYERGFLTALSPSDLVEIHMISDPASELKPGQELTGHILRQRPGPTAWFIDPATRTRRWIPDGATWNCLGGDQNAITDVPAYAIWTYPLGPTAECPSRR